jgi:S1-C subfamily serine protease
MRFQNAILSALALSTVGVTAEASAQLAVAAGRPAIATRFHTLDVETARAVIGIATSVSTGARDTLGLLVSSVTAGSPAEKAGILEGNRIAAINGVNLRLATADLGDADMERVMRRRLTRELEKLQPGDDVDLRVYADGQTKSVKIKTVEPDSLYPMRPRPVLREMEDRASLGIGYGTTGSKRDTLGIFVNYVEDEGPAAKAGIEEGARIQAINGVDLRVGREDAGDDLVSSAKLGRFDREMSKVKVGDAVELRVYQNGQVKTVKATAASWMDRRGRARVMRSSGPGMTIIRHPDAVSIDVNAAEIAATARRAAETAAAVAGHRIDEISRMFGSFATGATIRW